MRAKDKFEEGIKALFQIPKDAVIDTQKACKTAARTFYQPDAPLPAILKRTRKLPRTERHLAVAPGEFAVCLEFMSPTLRAWSPRFWQPTAGAVG